MILREERIGGPDYFAIACKRVDEAARQPDLLIPETRQAPQQTGFDL